MGVERRGERFRVSVSRKAILEAMVQKFEGSRRVCALGYTRHRSLDARNDETKTRKYVPGLQFPSTWKPNS
jgi:hypothetical protein